MHSLGPLRIRCQPPYRISSCRQPVAIAVVSREVLSSVGCRDGRVSFGCGYILSRVSSARICPDNATQNQRPKPAKNARRIGTACHGGSTRQPGVTPVASHCVCMPTRRNIQVASWSLYCTETRLNLTLDDKGRVTVGSAGGWGTSPCHDEAGRITRSAANPDPSAFRDLPAAAEGFIAPSLRLQHRALRGGLCTETCARTCTEAYHAPTAHGIKKRSGIVGWAAVGSPPAICASVTVCASLVTCVSRTARGYTTSLLVRQMYSTMSSTAVLSTRESQRGEAGC